MQADDSKVLAILPFGAMEDLRHLRMDGYAASKDAVSNPDQPNEMNWLAVAVPWGTLLTASTVAYQGGFDYLNSASAWDTVFRNITFELGTDGNEFYGGEGVPGTVEDVIPAPIEEVTSTGAGDEPRMADFKSAGPTGIQRLFSREVLMRPLSIDGVSSNVRWFDEFNEAVHRSTGYQQGGCIMIGAVRYTAQAETNFNVEASATPIRYTLGPLIGGDMSRVQSIIRNDTGETGDHLRTMLFHG